VGWQARVVGATCLPGAKTRVVLEVDHIEPKSRSPHPGAFVASVCLGAHRMAGLSSCVPESWTWTRLRCPCGGPCGRTPRACEVVAKLDGEAHRHVELVIDCFEELPTSGSGPARRVERSSCGACPAKSGSRFAYPMSDKSVAPEAVDRLVVGTRDLVEVVLGEDEGSSDLSVCQSPLLFTWMLSDLFPYVVRAGSRGPRPAAPRP
jgi:hypothetical protein